MNRTWICGLIMTVAFARPKVLILSMQFGHAEISGALKRSLSTCGIDVDILDSSLIIGSPKLYEWSMRCSPLLFKLWEIITKGSIVKLTVRLDLLCKLIEEGNYSMVICNFQLIQGSGFRVCKARQIPYIVIPADIGQPRKWHWIQDCKSTIYLLGSEYLAADARGYHGAIRVSGMILRPEFENIRDISKDEMKKRLGLNTVKPVILVAFGSAGANTMLEIAQMFRRCKDKQFIFICGTYTELQKNLANLNPDYTVFGYIKNMHEYMRAADVFIGKPGPGCVSEAIQCETPVIIKDGLEVMPQERPTIALVKEHNYGKIISNYKELEAAIEDVLQNSYTFPPNYALREATHFLVSCMRWQERYRRRLF